MSAGLDPKRKNESDRTGHGLRKTELPALAAQALEAQKASKPLEQGGALEQVAARIERVMGLTAQISRPP